MRIKLLLLCFFLLLSTVIYTALNLESLPLFIVIPLLVIIFIVFTALSSSLFNRKDLTFFLATSLLTKPTTFIFYLLFWPIRVIFFDLPDLLSQPSEKESRLLSMADNLVSAYWSDNPRKRRFDSESRKIFREAIKYYLEIIQANPKNATIWRAYYHLGKTYRAFQQYDKANEILASAYQLTSENLAIRIEYIWSCIETNQIRSATDLLKKSVKSYPENLTLKIQVIYILMLSKQFDMANVELDKLLQSTQRNNQLPPHYLTTIRELNVINQDILNRKRTAPMSVFDLTQ